MYRQKRYLKKDKNYIFDFIQNHPFAIFVLQGNELLATHIPVLTEGTAENFRLFGHIAHNNEQYAHLQNGTKALLIFQGPQAYVSSSWYREKEISTWDYSAVHVNGKLFVQSENELEESLIKLVSHFEKGQKNPLFYHDIPKEILKNNLPQITGFWFEPFKIQAIAKLHQGFEKDDVDSVIDHLSQNPSSREVSQNIKKEHGKNH